jgi:Fe-S cluster assembly protein SufD
MAEIMMMKTPAETRLSEAFEAARSTLPGDTAVRDEAFRRFAERGLPHRRVEDFKYTDLRTLMREAAPLAAKPSAADAAAALGPASALGAVDAVKVAIVNGHVVREASGLDRLPAGIEIVPLSEALVSAHPLLAKISPVASVRDNPVYELNSAFMADGAVIRIAAGTTLKAPIHLRFVTTGTEAVATATRVLLVVEDDASLTLIETHEGSDGASHQLNDVLEIVTGDRVRIQHVRLNAEGAGTLALSTLAARLGAHVSFTTLNTVVGSAVSRHEVHVTFAGEHSTAQINGATMIRGRQHADTTLVVNHSVPHCQSRELFKTVIDDEAAGVFQGKIIVEPHAQKTDGRMMSAALLLSEGGAMNNKPELEIFADDVLCAHGATCGQLDDDLLFYLMARGLPRPEAESLLVQAFLGEALEFVEHDAAREELVGIVEGWLRART